MLFVAWVGSPGGAVVLLAFYAGPILVTLLLSWKFQTNLAQAVLLASLPTYFAWIGYDLYNAFFANLDPQSGIVLIAVGIMSLPVMIPLWILAIILEVNWKPKRPSDLPETTSIGIKDKPIERPPEQRHP